MAQLLSRTRRTAWLPAALLALAMVAAGPASPALAASPAHLRLSTARIWSGLHAPVTIAAPNDGSGRLFVVERRGVIKVRLPNGHVQNFLDLRSRVLDNGDERGMLGLAFDPGYGSNAIFYVYYTDRSGDDRLSRFHASSDGTNHVSPSTETILLTIPHRTHANHNGGQLAFAPDGYLYIGVGDGGGAGDPAANSQRLSVLLGKILRIDPESRCGKKHYCIPPDNPFAGSTTRRQEIWDFGFRNPWRFSFDPSTKWMWVGDVGEKAREEVDTSGGSVGGRNYGWDCREGTLNTQAIYGGSYCNGRRFVGPRYQYSHASGRCAIIGGYVYRGSRYSSQMGGIYIFGDYCSGEVWGMRVYSSGHVTVSRVYHLSRQILTFGESASGELYMADASGNVYHLKGHTR